MFSKKMNEAVLSVQKCLDNCCKAGNISVRAAEDIDNFFQLVQELDPKGINFQSSNLFVTLRINSYKHKIDEFMPSINNSIDILKQDAKIAGNTLKTLRVEKAAFDDQMNFFKEEKTDESDREFFQQLLVVENTAKLLDNTISEYEYLHRRISEICTISAAVFNHSLLSSKISDQIRNAELSSSEFKRQYADLLILISNRSIDKDGR